MDISIIIVSWNTKQYLEECLNSIYADLTEYKVDVWVVDNASSDSSTQMVKVNFPDVHLIENEKNIGFARANNVAIRKSTGKYVWLLNSDAKLYPNALEYLIDYMDSHPEAGAVGSMYHNPDGSLQTSCYPLPTLSREFWRLFHLDKIRPYGVYRMDMWSKNEPKEVEVLQGASLMLRREALDQVGLFDEDYFMYTEEVDLCLRLKEGGWHLFWVPNSRIVHFGGQSTQLAATKMFLQLYNAKIIYFRKNHGWASVLMYKLILILASITRIIGSSTALFKQPSERKPYLTITKNYYLLLRKIPSM